MSKAEKKRKELGTLELLRRLLPGFPQGDMVPGEEPDFIITIDNGRKIGIELTELHREFPPSEVSSQSQESLRHRIVRRAQELYANTGGPFLDVLILFRNVEFNKAGVRLIAQKIAEIIQTIIPAVGEIRYAEADYESENDFPDEIHYIRVFSLPGATRNFFSSPSSTWVANLRH